MTGLPWRRPRSELLLLVLVAVAALLPVYPVNQQDLSRLCLTQALVHGRLSNDTCLASSIDQSSYGGHLYSDKAPGLSVLEIPSAEALRLRPADQLGGHDPRLWGVRLLSVGLAFLLGAFMIGRVTEGLAPGRGGAALVAFALGTLVAPLAAANFSHVAAGSTAFAAFLLAWRGRFLLAGLVAGAAMLIEYQVVAILAILGLYAASRGLRALGFYAAGVLPGTGILLAYNALAFGSPWHLSYRYVAVQEQANGFFGIGAPHLHSVYEVFAGSEGLLIASPVLLAAGYGLVRLRRLHLAEALVCAAVVVFFVVLNCGYFLPYGGGSPGPRFLVPALPFLAVGLGPAFARRTNLTALLATLSVIPTLGLTLVWTSYAVPRHTIWGEFGRLLVQGRWSRMVQRPTATALDWAGIGFGALAMVAAAAAALVVALRTTPWDLRRTVPLHPWWTAAAAAAVAAVLVAGIHIATVPPGLRTSISASSTAAFPGDEVDFAVTLANVTGAGFGHVVLTIELPPEMQLLGNPVYERGLGCTGTSTISCNLDFLGPHMRTAVRFGVRLLPNAGGNLDVLARGSSSVNAGPGASFTVATGSS